MASHHHHHCHQLPPPIPTSISTTTTCYCINTPPPPQLVDPHLLQSLISLIQSSSQNPNPIPTCHCDPLTNRRHTQRQIPQKDPIFSPNIRPTQQDVFVSLVNRIEALESSLRRRDSSLLYGSNAVREAAARIIQLHFRAYLVGRSRSLRHLKDLAFIKSKFNALKSSISDQSRFDPVVLSRRIVDLLYKVDSIQDRDPMIVNGKKLLTRDLVGFLEYIDVIAVKRHAVLTRAVKKMSFVQSQSVHGKPQGLESDLREFGRDQRVTIETLRDLYASVDGDEEDAEEVSSEEEVPYVSPRVMKKKSADRKGEFNWQAKASSSSEEKCELWR